MLSLINPVRREEPFDHPGWVFEVKFDGFRAAADAVRGRLISRNGNRMRRFEEVLNLLPPGLVLDGELVVLDDAGPSVRQASVRASPSDVCGLRPADC
jgi:ATP-dependent DNA ligase